MNPATDLRSGHDRRHSDPPSLWIAVLAGSLIVHLLLLLSGRLFLFRVSSQKPARVAAPIELIDLSPKSSSKVARSTTPKVAKSSVAPQTATRLPNADSSVPPPVPDQPSAVQQVIKPSPVPVTPTRSIPKSAPTRSRVIPSPVTPSPKLTTQPDLSTPITPSPQPPFQPAPAPDATAAPAETPAEPTPVPAPSPSGIPLPDPEIGRVPGEPTQGLDESKRTNAGLPNVENAIPRGGTGVKADLLDIQDGNSLQDGKNNGGGTIPDKIARPIESSRLFLTLNYPPEVELNLGQTIRLIVLVDRTGKPKVTSVVDPSRSQEYDKFVSDLIQDQWTFEPATLAGQPVESLLNVSVRLNSLK
ncbi:hypothetical protein C7B65_12150 [Phormidesmis priestleyi ULC007]|uniref:TonB C-terminal domain-containing protein n=1 Tax=Phormidesmis priestleyi ULC007 TaxID=1920490 RepID=A0A2T1DFP2_9CYAN|nr:hypothetical protein [Phormidesmis priestleyi]PSB19312.1 hypothetical protein C7B65_12150 [Phormidesmis priestleyi ULC007]PZO52197.1 MAG: hypothetical protein DCF14_06935 [Phormidesmis priestleyi]